MTEQFQENFFLAARMLLLLVLEIYIILTHYTLAGASAWMLLLLACFILAGKVLVRNSQNQIEVLLLLRNWQMEDGGWYLQRHHVYYVYL